MKTHWICRTIEALARTFILTNNLKSSNSRDLVGQIEDIMELKIAAQVLNIQATIHSMQRTLRHSTRRTSAVQKANILRAVLLLDIKEEPFTINILRDTSSLKGRNQVFPQQVTLQWQWGKMLAEDIQALQLKITMRVEIKFYSDQMDLTITPRLNTQDSTIRLRKSSVTATNIVVALNILPDIIKITSQPLPLSIIKIQDNTMTRWAVALLQWLEVALIEWICLEELTRAILAIMLITRVPL